MRKSSGFTLLESLLALLLTTTLATLLVMLVLPFEKTASLLDGVLDREGGVMLSPLLLSLHLAPAGNRAWKTGRQGLLLASGEISIQSDLDGKGGFPDGLLESSFEKVTLRASGGHLRLKSSRGGFQPLIRDIESLQLSDRTKTTVTLKLVAALEDEQRADPGSRALELKFYLWNLRPNLFVEGVR